MAVIDASVYVALASEKEEAHERSWAWFKKAIEEGEELFAPAIILTEVGAAISRGVQDPNLASQVVQGLDTSHIIEIIPIPRSLARRAATIAIENRIRGCDSLYVALAEQESTYLITLDHQQLERGARVITTRSP